MDTVNMELTLEAGSSEMNEHEGQVVSDWLEREKDMWSRRREMDGLFDR